MGCTRKIKSASYVSPMALDLVLVLAVHTFMINSTVLIFVLEVIFPYLFVIVNDNLILLYAISPPNEVVMDFLYQIVSYLHTNLEFLLICHAILKWNVDAANKLCKFQQL